FYTIESNSNLNKQQLLWDICGIAVNGPIYETRIKLDKAGVNFHLNSCIRYVPLLAFRKPIIGLDAPYFNTLRSGVTWRDRLSPDKLICLVSADTGKIIRFGKVDKVYSGPVDEMLRKHTRLNTLCFGGGKMEKFEKVSPNSRDHSPPKKTPPLKSP
ncbi:hypothetical protein KCA24_34035, partial [Escherichia coli]|nr:hypothetical protein [Escherichia coli]